MSKNNYLIATIKSWNIDNAKEFINQDTTNNWGLITDKKDLTPGAIKEIDPKYIFVTHWSWKIPGEIWKNYETVIFHPTDLPYGRGGTPFQNLIIREIYDTKLTAFRAVEDYDAGPIYLKRDFNMAKGSIQEIAQRASQIYFKEMIPEIIAKEMEPIPQEGEVVQFKRRKPADSDMGGLVSEDVSKRQLYDFIRMLDGEGYPLAYLPTQNGKLEFSNAELKEGCLETKVKFKPSKRIMKNI